MAGVSSAWTPMTRACGMIAFSASPMPPISPPPPTGTSMASTRAPARQLEADRALAGDDTRVIEGMDEDEPALGLDLHGAGIGLVVVLSVQDDLGAVPPRPRDLPAAPRPAW